MKPLKDPTQGFREIALLHRQTLGMKAAKALQDENTRRLLAREEFLTRNEIAELIDKVTGAHELLEALYHMQVCRSCAEGNWVECDGGKAALDVMKRVEDL